MGGKVRCDGKFGAMENSVGGKVRWEGKFGGRESLVAKFGGNPANFPTELTKVKPKNC